MALDLHDDRVNLRIRFPKPGTARLIIDYPRQEPYRALVHEALASLLGPKTPDLTGRPKLTQDGEKIA